MTRRRRLVVAGVLAALVAGALVVGSMRRSAWLPAERQPTAAQPGAAPAPPLARPGVAPKGRADASPAAQPGGQPTPAEVERMRDALLTAQRNAERAAASSVPPHELQARKAAAIADFRAAEDQLLRQQTLVREARQARQGRDGTQPGGTVARGASGPP